jgi:aminopeptidase N
VPLDFGGGATPGGYGIYNYSDGVLALSGWYPILAVYDEQGWNLDETSVIGDSVYSDIAFYSVDISLPNDLVLAASGVQTDIQTGNETTRYHYESGPTRDFFLIASPDFQVVSQMSGQTTVNAYYMPDQEAGGRAALEVASGALEIYNEKIGAYPYKELDVVESPMRNALGVEYPGIVMIGAALYQAPEKPEFEVTVAHEVAHQWWYNVVGNNVFAEPWLDEALATYSSGVFYEFDRGPEYMQGLEGYWQERYNNVLKDGGDDLVTGDLKHFESLNKPSIYGAIVYTKGALFFKALRQEIGDQAFFQALHDYYQSRYFLIGHANDLLAAFEKAYGGELDGFYQKWLYSRQ